MLRLTPNATSTAEMRLDAEAARARDCCMSGPATPSPGGGPGSPAPPVDDVQIGSPTNPTSIAGAAVVPLPELDSETRAKDGAGALMPPAEVLPTSLAGPKAQAAAVATCDGCGAVVTGQFCAACGTRYVRPGAASGWRAVAGEYAGAEQPFTIMRALWTIFRSPVRGPTQLALDPTFRGHVAYFAATVSIATLGIYVLMPRVLGVLSRKPVKPDGAIVTHEIILQYLIVAVFVPITYFLFRAVSTKRRTPMAYSKLWLLGAGTLFLSQLLFMISIVLVLVAAGLASVLVFNLGYGWIPLAYHSAHLVMWVCMQLYAGLLAAEFWAVSKVLGAVVFLALAVFVEAFVRDPAMVWIGKLAAMWPL